MSKPDEKRRTRTGKTLPIGKTPSVTHAQPTGKQPPEVLCCCTKCGSIIRGHPGDECLYCDGTLLEMKEAQI